MCILQCTIVYFRLCISELLLRGEFAEWASEECKDTNSCRTHDCGLVSGSSMYSLKSKNIGGARTRRSCDDVKPSTGNLVVMVTELRGQICSGSKVLFTPKGPACKHGPMCIRSVKPVIYDDVVWQLEELPAHILYNQ
ncbi:hypothetical protein TNCT_421231 [Trichonephila clavata]|uniref:Uncharacterized protein n=1 Tax=Trichonephila clavata TaxID=2740835 RepID=A0A8X6KML5_TRICU|nr:hypothetical protein TNCT_421231 [Trichonephila clavata]